MPIRFETFDWRVAQSTHEAVVQSHDRRVLNSAFKNQSAVFTLADSSRDIVLQHPEFYATILQDLRARRPSNHLPLIENILRTRRESPIVHNVSLVFQGSMVHFKTKDNDETVEYSRHEQKEHEIAIGEALDLLALHQPKAYRFVIDITRQIVVRGRLNLNGFFSSSQNSHVRRMTFDNMERASRDRTDLVEALVHEALHSYLYMIEENGRFLTNPGVLEVFVQSPWTGNRICLHSFVHACFVWFSLQTLWLSWPQGPRQSTLELVRQGFKRMQFMKIVNGHPQWIGEELKGNLLRVREAALGS